MLEFRKKRAKKVSEKSLNAVEPKKTGEVTTGAKRTSELTEHAKIISLNNLVDFSAQTRILY